MGWLVLAFHISVYKTKSSDRSSDVCHFEVSDDGKKATDKKCNHLYKPQSVEAALQTVQKNEHFLGARTGTDAKSRKQKQCVQTSAATGRGYVGIGIRTSSFKGSACISRV